MSFLDWIESVPRWIKLAFGAAGGLMSAFSDQLPEQFQLLGLLLGLVILAAAMAGLLLHTARERQWLWFPEWRRSRAPNRISMLELMNLARDKFKWDITGRNNLDVVELIDSFRQATLDGTVRSWGRLSRNTAKSLTKNEPLDEIPASHWRDYQFDWGTVINAKENFDTTTYNRRQGSDDPRTGGFIDVHFERGPALRWLRHDAAQYKGTRNKDG